MRAAVIGLLVGLLVPICPARSFNVEWPAHCRHFAATHSGAEGLVAFAGAVEQFGDDEFDDPIHEEISSVLHEGWQGSHPVLIDYLDNHQRTLELATEAAHAPSIPFPPASYRQTIPAGDTVALFHLMALEAECLLVSGEVDAALDQSLDLLRLAQLVRAPNVDVVQHIIGGSGVATAVKRINRILQRPDVSEGALRDAARRMALSESEPAPVTAAFRTNCLLAWCELRELRKRVERSPQEGIQGGMTGEDFIARWGEPASIEAEFRRLCDLALSLAGQPAWERPQIGEDFVAQNTDNRFLIESPFADLFNTWASVATRADTDLARLRLARALCALRLGEDTSGITDPFTGRPLIVTPEHIRSVGPDETDQQGLIEYDPTNGTVSAGDLVVSR